MFYTYIYHDPERLVPIYVGKGQGARSHKHLKKNTSSRFINRLKVLKRNGFEAIIEIVQQPDECSAFAEEMRLIKLYGRKDLDLGPLYNLTSGGEGMSNPSEETRQRMSDGIKASYTPELRLLRSTMQKGIAKSEDACKAMQLFQSARWSSPASASDRKKLSDLAKLRRGAAHGRSKTWSLLSPNGKLYLTSSCNDFCKERDLSYYGLRNKAVTRDTTPVSRGLSKGWSVLACSEKI